MDILGRLLRGHGARIGETSTVVVTRPVLLGSETVGLLILANDFIGTIQSVIT